MKTGMIHTDAGALNYIQHGAGPRLLLAFHGYSNDASIFLPLARSLEQEYTTVSVDLPHHGRSAWEAGSTLHPDDLMHAVKELMKARYVERVSLAGFSLGGRVCLSLVEGMPERIDRMLLIAPDGLRSNPLYYFLTRTALGNRLFTGFVQRPEKYMQLIDRLHQRNWLDASRYRFAMSYIQSAHARRFLLNAWSSLRFLIPSRSRVKREIQQNHIRTYIFMGRYDHVIPPRQAHDFARGAPDIRVVVLDKGHRVMDYESLQQIADCLR